MSEVLHAVILTRKTNPFGDTPSTGNGFTCQIKDSPITAFTAISLAKGTGCVLVIDTTEPYSFLPDWLKYLARTERDQAHPKGIHPIVLVTGNNPPPQELLRAAARLNYTICTTGFGKLPAFEAELRNALALAKAA